MRKPKILVVGSMVMDQIFTTPRFPDPGETVLGSEYRTAAGGKGANQAVQAARLGADVTLVGKVGDDAFGHELLQSANASSVDVSHVTVDPNATTAVCDIQIQVGDGQRMNRIIVVPGANHQIAPAEIAFLEESISDYDMVMLQLEISMEINQMVAAYAHAKGVPVMLNCAPIAPLPEELLKHVTYLSPNEHEAKILTGIEVKDDASIIQALGCIHAMGVERALITLGDRGVAYENEDGVLMYSKALSGLDVKDTTAAGDSFVGAFCTAVCLGVEMKRALEFANHTAALTVCRMGAQPSLPTIREVLTLMESRKCETAPFQSLIC